MAKIYHVVATARNRVIGKDNKLPWHFSEDLRYFKKLTTGSTVIMGRKTFESIGRPLPNRENFVISRTLTEHAGVRLFNSIGNAIGAVQTENAFIIGGAEIYKTTILNVDGIYLTRIDADYEGDAYYPEVPDGFEEVEIQCLREKDPKIDVVYYEKKENVSLEEKNGTHESATA
ncbi:MAG: dihydrofolate reductase [Candidatus Omnitrophica bacterium]|nr:dihydrofolate reductase [Candidatus Omnitrophota bacterium]